MEERSELSVVIDGKVYRLSGGEISISKNLPPMLTAR